ncbi:hypothetical protein K431DRAFT_344370 [Polychaeton citri CBS 116435]|uniref:Uncharacterized protein n=1 Tax=Polychaeton citri CBS 116435 TaxID=1314669 RepID=A0A9P4URF5_9PEZI|nr:hypothetical protein K431DRAFT_344370 [Polychaeton citri CBS 116435]
MPQDLFRWEDGNALVHHCPHCQTPLAHARCRTKCLIKHVEWCKKYHCQLFKKGSSQLCMACISSDEAHQKRHRQIAKLLRQLEKIREAAAAAPKLINSQQFALPGDTFSSKRERKAAKKIEKAAQRPKVVGEEEMRNVCYALHPPEDQASEEVERQHLLNDPAIKSNLPFHRGTARDRHLRIELIANDAKNEFEVPKEEMTRIKTELAVPKLVKGMTAEERRLIGEVTTAIKEDLSIIRREEEETMQRKSGFWRWASRKAYIKLIQSGGISGAEIGKVDVGPANDEDEGEGDDSLTTDDLTDLALDDSSDAGFSTTDASAASSRTGSISQASSNTIGSDHSTEATSSTVSSTISSSSSDVATPKAKQQGVWQVAGGKPTPNSLVNSGTAISIKLSGNKGLHHLRCRPDSSSPGFSGFTSISASDPCDDNADYIYNSPSSSTLQPQTRGAEEMALGQMSTSALPLPSTTKRPTVEVDEDGFSPVRSRRNLRSKEP